MKLQGAEATVEIKEDKVIKERPRKNYRHPKLDQRIRKQRTNAELNNIRKALRNGINVPQTGQKNDYILEMQKIEGETLEENFRPEAMKQVGENVQKLHEAGLIHGDLTTKNIMFDGEKIYLIDFGLSKDSKKTEDHAVDLHLLKQILESSHPEHFKQAWNNFLSSYTPEFQEKVLKRLEEIEERGRYK